MGGWTRAIPQDRAICDWPMGVGGAEEEPTLCGKRDCRTGSGLMPTASPGLFLQRPAAILITDGRILYPRRRPCLVFLALSDLSLFRFFFFFPPPLCSPVQSQEHQIPPQTQDSDTPNTTQRGSPPWRRLPGEDNDPKKRCQHKLTME